MDHDGLVLDYYGDGLAAMWNAPADQAEHAELACRAGLRMLETLPKVVADWAGALDIDLQLGVGVHTGMARVGNAGSTRRTKYGPRGANVNLTSRVETATKQIGLPMIVTQATTARLSNRLTTHRVCRARMPGIDEPVELFSVEMAAAERSALAAWQTYDQALRQFEGGDLEAATATLATIGPAASETPAHFLADYIERELDRKQNRRRADDRRASAGVITLNRK
jgi:adenylate cyclase